MCAGLWCTNYKSIDEDVWFLPLLDNTKKFPFQKFLHLNDN
jgi:hypothetical protein